ncbi:MAG: glutamine--tRNA ligase/YqeY domain fusion protein, partial [Smithella sp.]
MTENTTSNPSDFIRDIIDDDLKTNKNDGKVATRFPPEPNGYIHIGHAKSVCLNFGIARQYQGTCNLRLDDTDPAGESMEYVESIINDIRWLGFDWEDRLFYASDYFEKLYQFAVELIKSGNAYVCSLSPDEIREYRGTFTEPGKESPYRNRSVEENLDLFQRMRAGEFADGAHVLRARIDMASPNIVMRDPIIYRIKREPHYRTGNKWVIYPMYDFAHCLSDALEGIVYSICTLEFENNRPLYDWIVEKLITGLRPRQIEFARLNLSYTVLSKRRLIELVEKKYVHGWDDPRMPTVSGMRRRGYTPEAIKNFCAQIGVAKNDNLIDVALLEYCVREDLNEHAPRAMCVLKPLRVVIDNYPENQTEEFECANHPQKPEMGMREVPFSKELYIERDDFMEAPPKKYHRLG